MKYSLFFVILFYSCSNSRNSVQKTENLSSKGIVRFTGKKGSECDQHRQLVVFDDLKGKQFSLVAVCNLSVPYTGSCGVFKAGTFKTVFEYNENFIVKQTYYKPIFDSIEFLKIYPTVNRDIFYHIASKPIFFLERVDSLMISRLLNYKKDNDCYKEYLNTIKGFYLDTVIIRDDKEKKFKNFVAF
jgi:hypothetical protein